MTTYLKVSHTNSENDTISHSSNGSPKSSLLVQVQNDFLKQRARNVQKYKKIVSQNPRFFMEEYEKKQSLADITSFSEDELSLQLDRLLQDQCKMDEQLNKIAFDEQEKQEILENQVSSNLDLYSFLRTVWARKDQFLPSQQKIDAISQKVGSIKRHIKIMAQSVQESDAVEEFVKHSKQYMDMKQNLDQIAIKYESDKKYWQLSMKQLSDKIQHLQAENSVYIEKLNCQMQKKKKNEEELLKLRKKLQILEIQIFHKEKQLKKSALQHKDDQKYQNSISIKDHANTYSILFNSKLILQQRSFQTNKTLEQAINYLEESPHIHMKGFDNLFDSGIHHMISPPKHIWAKKVGDFSNILPKRRKMTGQINQVGDVQFSKQKKKRFERKINH